MAKATTRKTTAKSAANKTEKEYLTNKLETMSPSNPIPFEGGRGFSFVAEAEYLPFLHPDDTYAQLLLQSRLLSTTHNACIVTKKNYCAGNGFETTEEGKIPDKKFTDWIKSMNIKNESAKEINKQIFENFFTFGNVPIELVRFTVGSKRLFFVYVHNFLEWRLSKPDPNDGISKFAIQSKLFLRENMVFDELAYEKAKKLPIYNPRNKDRATSTYRPGYNWVKDSNGAERTLIWYKNSIAGFDNYGLPTSVSGMIYQILEYKGARFNLDNLDNNMLVSAVLAIKGNITQKEINRIGKQVISTHTGDGKRGRVMVVGSEEGIDGSDLHNFSTQKEGSFSEADDKWTQKIILANEWDAILAGIISSSTMGKGAGFLAKIMEVKRNTVIRPAQDDVMDKVWAPIIELADKWLGLNTTIEKIQIKNNIDISALTDVDITPAVMVNEVRMAKGLPEDKSEKGKMYLGELGAEQKKGVYVKDQGGSEDV